MKHVLHAGGICELQADGEIRTIQSIPRILGRRIDFGTKYFSRNNILFLGL